MLAFCVKFWNCDGRSSDFVSKIDKMFSKLSIRRTFNVLLFTTQQLEFI